MSFNTKIFYCSGTTEVFVGVVMTVESCPYNGTIYDDGYCYYETHRKELTVYLGHAVDFDLKVWFNVYWEQTKDGGTPSTGTQAWSITVPAGLTEYSWTQANEGEEWRCKETRTCYSESTSSSQPEYQEAI